MSLCRILAGLVLVMVPGLLLAGGVIGDDTILHIGHSANLVKIDQKVLVFDYPYGSQAFAEILQPLEPNDVKDEDVYVFASHVHGDHFNIRILSWKDTIRRIKYILSYDIARAPKDAVIVRPGKTVEVDGMTVRGYPSTDAGVAFSVYVGGRHIYFSGDNGYWNWNRDKSEEDYVLEALSCIDRTRPIDLAFQVCMAKAEGMGEGGIGIFAELFGPGLLVPIHSNGDYSINAKVVGQLQERGFQGRFWALGGKGETMSLSHLPVPAKAKEPVGTLHEAAWAGDAQAIESLVSSGSRIDGRNSDHRTALHLAAGMGYMEAAKALIDAGADVNAKDKYDWTPLHVAVQAYRRDVVELLLGRGAAVDARCREGRTALDVAVTIGAEEIAKILLNAGADVHLTAGSSKRSALHAAAMLGDVGLVKLVLAHGANVDAGDRLGTPALFFAVEGRYEEVVRMLLAAGADVNQREKNGRTALHRAVMQNVEDMAEFLIDKGADVNIRDRYGHTPLKIAIMGKRTTMAAMLQKYGAVE
ncbi:MAG: ankyrin repeat domain-containing protein [Sedimentisphaerales bacterium]|nr:ankyrin repeat domain-containing protein [Sedimentisphaerales bacterium]